MQAQLSQALKHSIKQSINQRLIQGVDVLACNLVDLNELINSYVIKNPFLKVKHGHDSATKACDNDQQLIIDSLEQPITLSHHLKSQLTILKLSDDIKLSANIIIKSLDDDGYLRTSLSDLANTTNCSKQDLDKGLAVVQTLEPLGVAARNLSECFYLQLNAQNKVTNQMLALINNIEKISSISRNELASICGVSAEDLADMLNTLRALDPSPGNLFSNDTPAYITPDIILEKKDNKSIDVRLNNDEALKVFFDEEYFDEIYAKIDNETDKVFLRNCYKEAKNLIEDIHKRESSLSRISRYIIDKQENYLLGLQLNPINLKQRDIASTLDIHESTVSRAVNSKYASYQGRTIALQEFLGSLSNSSDEIALQIQSLINNESFDNILSDEDIVKILNKKGINIARRTVSKYRLELNIPSSLKRRQQWARYS